jgi:Fur family transcriptional regulator, ferric uptake regulator
MTNNSQAFVKILKNQGYSVTKQRQFLFELLVGSEAVSMRDLCKLAAGKMDRASVYRTVAVFEKTGITHRINIGWKYKVELSDAFAEHHHHLTCLNCKRVIPINTTELESFIENLTRSHNFQPTEHQIEVQGCCEKCRSFQPRTLL